MPLMMLKAHTIEPENHHLTSILNDFSIFLKRKTTHCYLKCHDVLFWPKRHLWELWVEKKWCQRIFGCNYLNSFHDGSLGSYCVLPPQAYKISHSARCMSLFACFSISEAEKCICYEERNELWWAFSIQWKQPLRLRLFHLSITMFIFVGSSIRSRPVELL